MKYIESLLGGGYRTYYGISYTKDELEQYFDLLKEVVGQEEYEKILRAKLKRDVNEDLHITIMSAKEFEYLNDTVFNSKPGMIANKLQELTEVMVDDIEMKGLGVSKNEKGDVAYYIVVVSKIVDDIRSYLGLEKRDLHITLGFYKDDIWDVPKTEVVYTLDYKTPLKTLKESLYDNFISNGMSFNKLSSLLNCSDLNDYKYFAVKTEGLDNLDKGQAIFYAWNNSGNIVLEFVINADENNNLSIGTSCDVFSNGVMLEPIHVLIEKLS